MPLIDIKSELAIRKKQATTFANSAYAAGEAQVKRLFDLLSGTKGAQFAAKQAILSPETAVRRLAAISKQMVNPLGVLNNGKGFQSTFSNGHVIPDAYGGTTSRTAPVSPNYYHNKGVGAKIDSQVFLAVDESAKEELDIVPFYFTSYRLSNGEVQPGLSLGFRSFFSSIQDSVTGNWSSFNYTGRGEMFYVYGSRARSMNFSFKTAAFNYDQLLVMHEKVRKLKSFAAPTYNKDGYMQGNFYKLTIGNYIKDTPGIITSVGVTIADNIPWEVGQRDTILPHVLDITVQFTVLEDKTPEASFTSTEDLGALDTFNAINGPGGI